MRPASGTAWSPLFAALMGHVSLPAQIVEVMYISESSEYNEPFLSKY
jgi:hypothetical protein